MSRRAQREYKRAYQREYRRRIGGGTGGSTRAKDVGGDIQGMEELFQALNDVRAGVAIRARRKALQATATELTKAAKAATVNFDIVRDARATFRRAIYRKDPKTIERVGAKGKKRKYRPMRYTVSVRRGKAEAGGLHTSGSKKRIGTARGERKLNRDAWMWAFFEKGTKQRVTKKGYRRGAIKAQNVLRTAFEQARGSAISKGEKAGFAELKKILARQAAKARKSAAKHGAR